MNKIKRNKEIKVRLSFIELENLNECVKKTGLSREEYIRTLISGYVPAPRISDDVKEIIKQLRMIGNNLNQIAVIGYKTGTIDILKYKRNCSELEKNVQLILSNVTEPTRMEILLRQKKRIVVMNMKDLGMLLIMLSMMIKLKDNFMSVV